MSRSAIPYVFLAVLLAILLFIVGVRYGQRVELVNKNITLLISIPPSPTVAPTQAPLGFSEYEHDGCRISILIPNVLNKTSESSNSAMFSTNKTKLGIALACEKKSLVKSEKELQVNLTKVIRALETQTKDTVSYRFVHPITLKTVTITTSRQYLPLVQKSITTL